MIALVVTVPADQAELASDALWALGVVAIEERVAVGGAVELWTSLGDDQDLVTSATSGFAPSWQWRMAFVDETVADTWRQFAAPVRVADDLVVCPAWLLESFDVDITVVHIEPGSTFGMGDHPTTVASLRALRRQLVSGATVLDVGCGSGVLAVTAVMLGASSAHGIDISPAAVPTTVANAQRNGVADRITAATTPLADVPGTYDLVLANILAPALVELSGDLCRVLAPGGSLVISGILADRYDHVLAALTPLRVVHVDEIDGWVAVTLRR
ncbi:MAG: 50S ribosomal protein L11 methyltransferase [Ilumatobacteraceae bacterium]